MLAQWLATVTPFTLTSPSQFRAVPPPSVTSKRHATAYNRSRMGASSNSDRTPEQTDLALFWYSNYLVLWSQTLRDIDDSARLFALTDLAMGDSVITAWDTKFHYVFWRPFTKPTTTATSDANWQPLVNNPNYPDYTSGVNNVTGAITRAVALFFGTDEMTFTVATTYPLAVQRTRTYHRFTESEQLVESIKELDPDQPIVMLRKSDAQLLLEVSAHKQRPSLCPFKYTNEND
jgi:hypothetical protein